jgi:hypothetical protein
MIDILPSTKFFLGHGDASTPPTYDRVRPLGAVRNGTRCVLNITHGTGQISQIAPAYWKDAANERNDDHLDRVSVRIK